MAYISKQIAIAPAPTCIELGLSKALKEQRSILGKLVNFPVASYSLVIHTLAYCGYTTLLLNQGKGAGQVFSFIYNNLFRENTVQLFRESPIIIPTRPN